jgi:hypothetical protein
MCFVLLPISLKCLLKVFFKPHNQLNINFQCVKCICRAKAIDKLDLNVVSQNDNCQLVGDVVYFMQVWIFMIVCPFFRVEYLHTIEPKIILPFKLKLHLG